MGVVARGPVFNSERLLIGVGRALSKDFDCGLRHPQPAQQGLGSFRFRRQELGACCPRTEIEETQEPSGRGLVENIRQPRRAGFPCIRRARLRHQHAQPRSTARSRQYVSAVVPSCGEFRKYRESEKAAGRPAQRTLRAGRCHGAETPLLSATEGCHQFAHRDHLLLAVRVRISPVVHHQMAERTQIQLQAVTHMFFSQAVPVQRSRSARLRLENARRS